MPSFVVPLFTSGRSGNNKETTRDSTRAISRRRSIWWDLLHCEKFTSSFDFALYHFVCMGDIQGPCDSTRCQGRMEHFEAKSSGKLEYEKWWHVLKMIQECGTKRWDGINDCLVSVSIYISVSVSFCGSFLACACSLARLRLSQTLANVKMNSGVNGWIDVIAQQPRPRPLLDQTPPLHLRMMTL